MCKENSQTSKYEKRTKKCMGLCKLFNISRLVTKNKFTINSLYTKKSWHV